MNRLRWACRRAVSALSAGLTLHGLAAAAVLEVQVRDRNGQPLPGAAVYLESAAARAAVRPAAGVQMQQLDRRFVPDVLVVPRGTEVQFPNNDKVRHHVYSVSPAKTFDLKLYLGTPANPVLFDRAGVAVLGCNIHDQMVAWVLVVDTPHYARSDARGQARLAEVPPGDYQLLAWHPELPLGAPAVAQALTLPAGGAAAQVRLPVLAP